MSVPPPAEDDEVTITQRAAIVGYEFGIGRVVTTTDIMRRFGLSRTGAWLLLNRIAGVLPIYIVDDSPGQLQKWRTVGPD